MSQNQASSEVAAMLSALEARLGSGRLRLYAAERVPSDTDDTLVGLLSVIEAMPRDDRTATGRNLTRTVAWGLRDFAVRMATRAVRNREPTFIRYGLEALALEAGTDDARDFFVAVAPLYHAAKLIGIDPRPLFDEARGFVSSEVSEFIGAFPRRRPEAQQLKDFGFHTQGAGSTFQFVDDAPTLDDPVVRDTMKKLLG